MAEHKGIDSTLVETIVSQVKSQGVFDNFRRECLADVDTKPAFQNLKQLVDKTVNKFLSKQEWTPELNKNQLREKLRRHIIEMNFLDAGVERIVDQVVNPKVSTVFQPKIEEMLCSHLGIERPKEEKLEPPGLTDLCLDNIAPPPLPKDEKMEVTPLPIELETVSSPDSNPSNSDERTNSPRIPKDTCQPDVDPPLPEDDVKMEMDDEESPPFEPIQVEPTPVCPIKTESQSSNISGLTSQDSIESEGLKEDVPQKEILVKSFLDPDTPNDPTAGDSVSLPGVSPIPPKDDSQLSQVSSDTQNTSADEPLKMDISEEAQMPSRFSAVEGTANAGALTSFDLQKESITFEQVKRESATDSVPSNPHPKPIPTSDEVSTNTQPVVEPQVVLDAGNCGEVNKILVKTNVSEDTEESLLDSGDSLDLKIVEDSRGSVSASNSADTRESSKKDHRSRSSSHRKGRHGDHRTHRSSSSSASQHRSSNKGSSRDKDREKDRDRHRNRDHHKSDRSRSRKDKERERDRERDKKKSNGDPCRERTARRSTDRDSNDGANTGGNRGPTNGTPVEKTELTSTKESNKTAASPKSKDNSSGAEKPKATSEGLKEEPEVEKRPDVVNQLLDGQELNLHIKVPSDNPTEDVPMKKPKIAANLKEAMKLMKVRKSMNLKQNKSLDSKSKRGTTEGVEESLHYFPDNKAISKFKESASEKWWKATKEQNDAADLIKSVQKFLDGIEMQIPTPTIVSGNKKLNGLISNDITMDIDSYEETEVVLDDLPGPVTENNNVHTENKNYDGQTFNQLVNGDSEVDMSGVPEKNRAPKAPVSQRYTSEDLYKPRPICGRSRRSRVLEGDSEGPR